MRALRKVVVGSLAIALCLAGATIAPASAKGGGGGHMGGGFDSGPALPSGGGFNSGPASRGGGSFQAPSALHGGNTFHDNVIGQTASGSPHLAGRNRYGHGQHFFAGGGYGYGYNCGPYWNGYAYVYPNGYACGYGATY
jgi:hypothetical protein